MKKKMTEEELKNDEKRFNGKLFYGFHKTCELILHLSDTSLRREMNRKHITYLRAMDGPYFSEEACEDWLQSRMVFAKKTTTMPKEQEQEHFYMVRPNF